MRRKRGRTLGCARCRSACVPRTAGPPCAGRLSTLRSSSEGTSGSQSRRTQRCNVVKNLPGPPPVPANHVVTVCWEPSGSIRWITLPGREHDEQRTSQPFGPTAGTGVCGVALTCASPDYDLANGATSTGLRVERPAGGHHAHLEALGVELVHCWHRGIR